MRLEGKLTFCGECVERMTEDEMKKNNIHKIFAGLLAMIVIMCAAVIGWTVAEPEQTKAEPEPLVINTTDDVLLTVIDEQGQEVFQYAGEVKDWTVEGERYMNIYINRVGEE